MNASLQSIAGSPIQPAASHQGASTRRQRLLRPGFTLVEIMIVVVIIGLLAAMAIPAFSKVRQQSRVKAVLNNMRQLATASQEYMLEKGATQAAYSDLVGTGTDYYIHNLTPVIGESYASVTVGPATTQISVSNSAIGTVTYNL
jgi:type IV pilus assembly protein PilA